MPNKKPKTITGQGLVDKLSDPQTSSGGKPYYWVTIDGTEYSVWDLDLIGAFQTGCSVEFGWQQAGKYRNIVSVESDGNGSRAGGNGQPIKDELIVRQTCIKVAGPMMGVNADTPAEKAAEVIAIADLLEEWVWAKKSTEPEPPEED